MDKKSNILSGSREHIAELSDIIKTAILREIGAQKPKDDAANTGDDIPENTTSYDEIRHTSVPI